jgi:hypothetical protein
LEKYDIRIKQNNPDNPIKPISTLVAFNSELNFKKFITKKYP